MKLTIEYDGTNYSGWQRQENALTIQEKIEEALSLILQEQVTIVGAGRTDAGVHARGQVANFRTQSTTDLSSLRGGLNGLLPDDIVVREVEQAPMEFHARHSVREREYSYTITRTPTALMRFSSWHIKYDLDLALMKKVSEMIVGVHDFESFCKVQSGVEHHRCNVSAADWKKEGSLLIFTIRADRFLHGMVRTLVGTMVDIGRGYTPIEQFSHILGCKDRAEAGMAAPAKGLVLERILY
ncbi:MAG: tRNA pseudouridine(38-40) synthase TruA [Ignavibacteriae bacterium]|nr:tRNA pseudouridine(38-40) synthase TruA [Ignavibacteriota bacterium]